MELEKLFKNIHNQLKSESIKCKKLKICKHSFEISKVIVLSLATGLSFVSIFSILSLILIPIIDVTKHNSNVDNRLFNTKLQKDLLKELYNYRNQTHKELSQQKIINLCDKLVNKLSIINTF